MGDIRPCSCSFKLSSHNNSKGSISFLCRKKIEWYSPLYSLLYFFLLILEGGFFYSIQLFYAINLDSTKYFFYSLSVDFHKYRAV